VERKRGGSVAYLGGIQSYENTVSNPYHVREVIVRWCQIGIRKNVEHLVVWSIPTELSAAALLDAVFSAAARNLKLYGTNDVSCPIDYRVATDFVYI